MSKNIIGGFFICAALAAQSAQADPVIFIERSPADARAVSVQVEQSALHGRLAPTTLTDLVEAGRQLFDTKFTTADGAGRPLATQALIPTHFKHPRELLFQRASGPDANSCTSCHNDPISGGAGDFTANVFTSEGTESADFDTVDAQFSNERGTNHLFGSGLIELLAREMSADLLALQATALRTSKATGEPTRVSLESKGVQFGHLTATATGHVDVSGVEGIDADLIVRPFSQKGVTTSLRAFSVSALNAHHGMQAEERFGAALTGELDFDGDGFQVEFTAGQVSALTAYQASLEAPTEVAFSRDDWQASAQAGAALFNATGCNACHMQYLPLRSLAFLDPGPYDTAGTLASANVETPAIYDLAQFEWAASLQQNEAGEFLVPLFGDLKRHVIADNKNTTFANELMGQSFVARDVFITAELWGIADTGPYGHRGDITTLDEVILAHGGEAAPARDNYASLQKSQQDDLITYLMGLRTPQ